MTEEDQDLVEVAGPKSPSFDELVAAVMQHEEALRGMGLYLHELRGQMELLIEFLGSQDEEVKEDVS
jgi:hypothetical protein